MPVEVIDLLSSPPAAAPSHDLTGSGTASPTRSFPAARSLTSDIREFTKAKPAHRWAPPGYDQDLPPISLAGSRTSGTNATYDLYFTSDDFRSTGEIGGASLDIDYRSPKRRRVSKEPDEEVLRTSALTKGSSEPSGVRFHRQRLPQLGPDPIEFTSSPEIGPPTRSPVQSLPRVEDPFATSSPKRADRELQRAGPETNTALDSDPFKSTPVQLKTKSPRKVLGWDPISSSAPEAERKDKPIEISHSKTLLRSRSEVIELSDSDDDDGGLKASSDSEFPELGDLDVSKLRAEALAARYANARTDEVPARKALTAKPVNPTNKSQCSRDNQEQAAAKEAERERKRKEKELAKEQKAREKQRTAALAEVNKVRTDKKVSSPEMIVDLSSTLNPTVKLQAEELLRDISVQSNSWAAPLDNVIKWRRKVSSRFNDELGHWEPVPTRIQPENHVMVVVQAAEFVKLALADDGEDLEAHVLRMQRHFRDQDIIYLIEGLTPWMRKNRNVRNRQFVSAVRGNGDDSATAAPPSTQPPRRRKKDQPQEYIDEDSVEDALLQLQVVHGVLIHHTNTSVETAQWITTFTQHISTIPYRRQKEQFNDTAAFCMETGQVRTGDGRRDTYVRMMQEIVRVTAPIAYGVAAEFDSVAKLVRGLEEGGPLRLEDCRKSANKDGAFSDRSIGQAVSKRLYKVFTGRDETSTDI
ncbi:uncharacterized protein E0L32_007377 [Thyridium curvatum]|uniref:ERCC4 domain-containing protein n=1 Tax=Thyridium curvatum TaxID=1093900 RepID=A0A507B3I6_9PEZI|nr:uncharacterized protein E0L32_007377 [Thyridium curvatum]TPX11879.1 hypothetical protein E0L32_007377 [Thyridium curvatum]